MNSNVRMGWDAALKRLNPTESELAHGLELHKASIVCDTYGFAPTNRIDGDALVEAMKNGASPKQFRDMKEEMGMLNHLGKKELAKEYMDLWNHAGVTCIFQNAGEEGQSVKRLVKRLARFTHVVDAMPDFYERAVFPEQIEVAKKKGKHCIYYTGNGVPLPEEWDTPDEELAYIKIFYQLGIKMMHLTYNRRNMIGDGCGETNDAGLSDFGKMVIAEMNRVGIIVDVAHSGQKTSLEAAKASTVPMVASHSSVIAVNNHFRGKNDEVIKAIADTGGYIGICCMPKFLGGKGDINTFIDHIDYVAKKFGPDYVTIGTDTSALPTGYHEELDKIAGCRPPDGRRWESLWPPYTPSSEITAEGQASLAWTNWPLFTVALVQRGYSDDDIQKIIGGNMLRVLKAALPLNPYA